MELFEKYLGKVTETINKLDRAALKEIAESMIEAYNKDACIYIFGNGGSGATASHICGDFIKGVSYGLNKRFRFICLNDNPASLMAIANDIGWDDVFVEPLKNFMKADDLVIGISGSGNSNNVVKALTYAKTRKVKTVAFCGYKGGKIKELADLNMHADIMDMEVTEDIHLVAFHCIKQYIIAQLHDKPSSMGNIYDQRIQ